MGTSRLEAFSDGVIAVIITIMVLEMKVPHGEGMETLVPVIPLFLLTNQCRTRNSLMT